MDIDMKELAIHIKGEVIAIIQTLTIGELLIKSIKGREESRFCLSNDRAYA